LASYAPDLGQAIAREITLTIEEADAHMNLSDRDILITTNPQLTFNPSVTDSAGVALSWRTVLLANTTGETSVDHVLKLADVIDDAVQNNADLEADRAAVAVRQFAVDNAKSALRPRVEAFANGTAIDEDRAESFGTPDQYESSLGVRVQRLLWSEPARANVRIQELLSDAQNQYFIEKRSDTIAAVAETFYQLAAASSLVRIQRDNINRTRAYLDQARLLAQVGKESRADVYRFESRLAEDNRALIDAYAGARLLRLRLDEYRGTMAPLITPSLVLLEITEADGNSTYAEELIRNAATVQATRRLEEFVIQSARNNSALYAAAQRQLAVRSREVQSRSRSLYSPTISAFTEVEYTWYKGGATGSSETQLAPGVTFDSSTLNTADDMNWRAGISVTLPVYTGGERIATLRQARSAEEQAMNELRSTESIVENRARVAVTNLVSSCNSLQEARTSVRSAGLGLELIEEAYRTGAADSLELLDGQNTVRIAEQRAATTEADFRVAWVRLLHATGRIEALTSTQEARRFVRAAEQAMGTK
jgi:outer membrane protein TolC